MTGTDDRKRGGFITSRLRDPVSGLTHCIGVLLAVAALVVLVCGAVHPTVKPWHIVAYSIFGTGLILLYTASTLYHWLPLSEKGIGRLRRFDHMMIFVLIAATYTPVCLIPLRGAWGWSLFGSIWGLAVLGICMKLFWMNSPRWFSTTVYIVMGWLAIIAVWPLVNIFQAGGLLWMCIGGLCYTLGAVIYAVKKPDPLPRIMGFHEIFHIFVMMGSASHFWMMYRYIMVFD